MKCLVLTCIQFITILFWIGRPGSILVEWFVMCVVLVVRVVIMLQSSELQVLVSEGKGYGGMERFLLQPIKSMVMPITGKA